MSTERDPSVRLGPCLSVHHIVSFSMPFASCHSLPNPFRLSLGSFLSVSWKGNHLYPPVLRRVTMTITVPSVPTTLLATFVQSSLRSFISLHYTFLTLPTPCLSLTHILLHGLFLSPSLPFPLQSLPYGPSYVTSNGH